MSSNVENSQQVVRRTGEPSRKPRPRGNFWEITYREDIPAFEPWPLSKETDLATETGKTNVEVTAAPGTRAVNLKEKRFQTCDFNHFALEDSSFADCTFVDCRFVKSDFDSVKFSRCQFETCHFLNVKFRKCQFIDCTFSNISASAEHLLFVESGISAAAFIDALVTNLAALPPDVTKDFQEYRHLSTKAKIARAIFISVRDEPELDQLFDANRCFEIALQRKKIAEAYWTTNDRQIVKRKRLYRATVWPIRLAALRIMQMAGFLTNWGRSPFRSVWFLVAAFIAFSSVYYFAFGKDFSAATLRALDCTFVFGYTRYAAGGQTGAIDLIMFLNTFAGFCWYALLVPALSKRLFR
jgi:uncharacterized protein YjbI with pentapeptide repeats